MARTLISFLLVTLLVTAVYPQEEWTLVLQTASARFSVMRIHSSKNGVRRAWVKCENAPDKIALEALGRRSLRGSGIGIKYRFTPEDSTLISNTATYFVSLDEFDPAQRRLRALQVTTYYYDGNTATGVDSDWTFTIPGTPGDTLLNYVCAH